LSFEIKIDRDVCMGSGQCSLYAPGTFGLDAMSVAIVTDSNGDSDEDIQLACEMCPTGAITLNDRPSDPLAHE
jgi:ferredoxin